MYVLNITLLLIVHLKNCIDIIVYSFKIAEKVQVIVKIIERQLIVFPNRSILDRIYKLLLSFQRPKEVFMAFSLEKYPRELIKDKN